MKLLAGIAAVLVISGCASIESQKSHEDAQIAIVKAQRDAGVQERIAQAQAQVALFEALKAVAVANPEHAPSVTVALATIGVSRGDGESNTPIIGLQRKQNEALEWVKALSPAASNLIGTVGVAAINASVAKRQSDNSRIIQTTDAATDAQIIESVANLGVAATNQIGVEVGGDYYVVSDSAVIDQSTSADVTTDASVNYSATDEAFLLTGTYNSSSNNTSGDTNTDSQNTSGDTNADSFNTSGDTTTDSSDNSDNSIDNSVTDTVP
jgi:hypothetical protein